MKTLIYNCSIVNEGEQFDGFVVVDGEIIEMVGHGAPDAGLLSAPSLKVDLAGAMLLPGGIDTHVHFRDPGLTRKGDMATESAAAAAGGITSVIDMPNTSPATVSVSAWKEKMALAATKSVVNYGFFIGATNSNLDQLLAADYSRVAGIKLFLGSSTGNMLVDSDSMLGQLFAKAPALIAVHAESERIVSDNLARARREYEGREAPVALHSEIRSREACVEASRHAVELARRHGARLHLCHISTADELDLLEPGSERITGETAPHYLWFTTADYPRLGARIKCNPAIKNEGDRRALREAVADGRIATIATDHAPHLLSDKEGDLFHAASGMPGIQFSLPVMTELSLEGYFPMTTVVERMSHAPARTFRIDRRGFIRPGYYADLTALARLDDPREVSDADVVSRCGWTPYVGARFHSRVISTWVNGRRVYDGTAVDPTPAGLPLRFGR
ncbi:MAG: dihydroorotase [Clostridium sp.]|nr:dihydroorotase [Clostridium sp.]